MNQEIRFCAVPGQGFPCQLHVQQLVCMWPTYDGYAKHDQEEELDEEQDAAWPRIISAAVARTCERMGWSLTTLEFRKTPTYWESEQRTWHLAEVDFDEEFVDDRQNFGHEFYLHIVGPTPVRAEDFFPDELPLLEWLHQNYAFVILGAEEPVLWAHWPTPDLFLSEVQTLARQHDHEMTHSKVPFRTYKRGKIDYVEALDEDES